MKTFYILNHRYLPTPYNHRFFVEKFARGFGYHGFDVKIVSQAEEITEPGFVMISNHYFFHRIGLTGLSRSRRKDFIRRAFSACSKIDKTGVFGKLCKIMQGVALKSLQKQIESKDVVVLAWFWFDRADYLKKFGFNLVFTGEKNYDVPALAGAVRWFDFYNHDSSLSLPIGFAADIDPEEVKAVKKDINVGFVGNRSYRPDWYNLFSNRPDCRIIPTPPFISEEEREGIYRRSLIILGLHADDNISNHVVVERVFEALAYGCICVTDHPDAPKATDGCAIYVKTKQEMGDKIGELLGNPALAREISDKGLLFAKQKGTYFHQAARFISLVEQSFGLTFVN